MAVDTRFGLPKLSGAEWKTVLKRSAAEFKSDDVPLLSASVAFRIFLAIIPSLIAAVAILGLVIDPSQLETLINRIEGFVPPSSAEFLEDQLEAIIESPTGSLVALIGGLLGGLFAATTAAGALVKALNRAYDVEETRKFVKLRLLALLICGALGAALAGVFVAIVVGPQIVRGILPDQLEIGIVSALISVGRYVVAVGILIVFFAFIFRVGPDRPKPPWNSVTPGSVLGVTGWILLSLGFSFYAATSGSYAATYGAFAGIIVLLVWLNLSFLVLLMGAELDSEIERLVREREPALPSREAADRDENQGEEVADDVGRRAEPPESADERHRVPTASGWPAPLPSAAAGSSDRHSPRAVAVHEAEQVPGGGEGRRPPTGGAGPGLPPIRSESGDRQGHAAPGTVAGALVDRLQSSPPTMSSPLTTSSPDTSSPGTSSPDTLSAATSSTPPTPKPDTTPSRDDQPVADQGRADPIEAVHAEEADEPARDEPLDSLAPRVVDPEGQWGRRILGAAAAGGAALMAGFAWKARSERSS